MLDPFTPLPFIFRPIDPEHLSEAISLVIMVIAFVNIPAFPSEHSMAVLLVELIFTFVHVTILCIVDFLPFAFTMLQAIFKLSNVGAAILPFILTDTIRLAKFILSCVGVTIGKNVCSLPML